MQRKRKILLKFIFFMAVLFSIGTQVCSNYNLRQISPEIVADSILCENNLSLDIDSVNGDLIALSSTSGSAEEYVCQMKIPHDCSIIINFCLSVWQPPKIV
jgi:hypothetical protein